MSTIASAPNTEQANAAPADTDTLKSAPTVGGPAPWFMARATSSENYAFDSCAGRYVVLSFLLTAGDEIGQKALAHIESLRGRFDDDNMVFFGVSVDPEDESSKRLRPHLPGMRYFWDFDRNICKLYGVATASGRIARRYTLVLDERLRLMAMIAMQPNVEEHNQALTQILGRLHPLEPTQPAAVQAPVLVVPRVFEQSLCKTLIDYYESKGGTPSGFMRERNGMTIAVLDDRHKKRSDVYVEDPMLAKQIQQRLSARLIPEIRRAFQFDATRVERYLIACYDAESGGYFRPHRDNTTSGTAHRRFAVTMNLNANEYDGGDLRFPEFGRRTYRAPTGGAVVFSCSLLHEATPVTRGKRYAYLPFLYDEAGARIREENFKFLSKDDPQRIG